MCLFIHISKQLMQNLIARNSMSDMKFNAHQVTSYTVL
jgi:hypothetical protein